MSTSEFLGYPVIPNISFLNSVLLSKQYILDMFETIEMCDNV